MVATLEKPVVKRTAREAVLRSGYHFQLQGKPRLIALTWDGDWPCEWSCTYWKDKTPQRTLIKNIFKERRLNVG